jgi:hypothetical protein
VPADTAPWLRSRASAVADAPWLDLSTSISHRMASPSSGLCAWPLPPELTKAVFSSVSAVQNEHDARLSLLSLMVVCKEWKASFPIRSERATCPLTLVQAMAEAVVLRDVVIRTDPQLQMFKRRLVDSRYVQNAPVGHLVRGLCFDASSH